MSWVSATGVTVDSVRLGGRVMEKCVYCGHALIWGADFDGDDLGYEQPGIVHTYTCPRCGADYTVFEPLEIPDEE